MTTSRLTAFALGILLAAAPLAAFAADTQAALDQIVADAQRVRAEAHEIRQMLRAKSPDFTGVQQRLSTLETHANALKQSIEAFDGAAAPLTEVQRAAFTRAKGATDTLHVLLANKTTMLADTGAAARNRGMLRAHAEGILKRAEMVQQQIARVRG